MTISIFGIVVGIISIYAFFKNEKLLLYMLVFLSTFTATELGHINLTTTPIQTFEFTGAVWLLREFINLIKTKPKISKEIIINKFKENRLATAFLMLIISIIMGEIALAVSRISVNYVDITGELGTVKFSMGNITQPTIIIFALVIMIVLSFKIRTKEEIMELLKVFCISSIFAVAWGLLQFVTYYLGLPYPAFLFNNNEYAYQGYVQIDNNIKRISSIALEPSTFAINLICFMPFIVGHFLVLKDKVKTKKYGITLLIAILTTTCAILTSSSTTYVGLVTVYGLFGLYILFGFIKNGEFADKKRNFMKLASLTIISISLAGILCIGAVKVGYKLGTIDYIETSTTIKDEEEEIEEKHKMTVGKLKSGSGQERMRGEKIGLAMLKYSPMFGIGFGSYRTFSMFTNVLLQAGIFGAFSLLLIIYLVIKELWKLRKQEEKISVMFLISIISATIGFFMRSARLSINILLDSNCAWI